MYKYLCYIGIKFGCKNSKSGKIGETSAQETHLFLEKLKVFLEKLDRWEHFPLLLQQLEENF